ncbi:MAG: AbrB/MazE/SpoVT family DNA-binding domain-containing protein [Acidobacteriia bacterium]|nr:AbrB/MazE/SpoVT family DNA-binding domain-containing protein [Terriglobia bacterium]
MDREGVVGPNGRLIIPADLRRKYRIKGGSRVQFESTASGIVIRPIHEDGILALRGILKGLDLPPDVERDPDREIE